MSVFFSGFMGNESELGTNKLVNRKAVTVLMRFVCSALRFVPHEPRKKALIPYIYDASNKDPY